MHAARALLSSEISHDRAKKGTVMSIVIAVFAAAAVVRGAFGLVRLLHAVPRSNADFRLPGVA